MRTSINPLRFKTRMTRTFLLLLLAGCNFAFAKEASPLADNPAVEARVMSIAGKLRCLVCQNQTLADSNAELAVDLRKQMREQIEHGATDQQVTDFMVARFGKFVLYRPPLTVATFLLWFGPLLLIISGAGALWRVLRRHERRNDDEVLSPGDRQRVAALLDSDKGQEFL